MKTKSKPQPTSGVAVIETPMGNHDDPEYDGFLANVNLRFAANTLVCGNDGAYRGLPLFTTDAVDKLWASYLNELPRQQRQYHTCHSCRDFIDRFGGLATIDDSGQVRSAIWNPDDAPALYRPAVAMLARLVHKANITGIFASSQQTLGHPKTGIWRHLSLKRPIGSMTFRHTILSPAQVMAAKREDFKNVMYALGEFPLPVLEQAVTLLKTDALYRSEKVLGHAKWLRDLYVAVEKAPRARKANIVWKAVALAPDGFCHPRSSMIGTLLQDLASGVSETEVKARFQQKMNPTKYQRPQATPKAGTIVTAEKMFAELQAANSLHRRFARLSDVQTVWQPSVRATASRPVANAVFGHVQARGPAPKPPTRTTDIGKMTWDKFNRTVLPDVCALELFVTTGVDNFGAFTTATDPNAPPILQWDSEERRNPVSWYVYEHGSAAAVWNLAPGWTAVTGISLLPPMWFGADMAHQGKGAMFILKGAKDNHRPSLCLFPEQLKLHFHPIRAVIEAHSKINKLTDASYASACGLLLRGSGICNIKLRASLHNGTAVTCTIDRWD